MAEQLMTAAQKARSLRDERIFGEWEILSTGGEHSRTEIVKRLKKKYRLFSTSQVYRIINAKKEQHYGTTR